MDAGSLPGHQKGRLGRKELSELKISYNGKSCHSDSERRNEKNENEMRRRKKTCHIYILFPSLLPPCKEHLRGMAVQNVPQNTHRDLKMSRMISYP